MKRIIVGLTSLVIALASPSMAQAYAHANRFGGSTTHSVWGGTSHTNTWGGTTTGAYGVGAVQRGAGGRHGRAQRRPGQVTRHQGE